VEVDLKSTSHNLLRFKYLEEIKMEKSLLMLGIDLDGDMVYTVDKNGNETAAPQWVNVIEEFAKGCN
jgi:hypothetical protein